jgi:hypothetical protein
MENRNNTEPVGRTRSQEAPPDDISVSRYGRTRYWAVWVNGELLVVTVYKKGAIAIRDKLYSGKAGLPA